VLEAVVKLLSKRWRIPIGATPKLEPEGLRAEWGSRPPSIQGNCLAFMAFKQCLMLATSIHTKHFLQNIMHTEKYSNINCAKWESQLKGVGSQLWGTGSVTTGSGSQIRGAGSEIRRDPP